MDLERSAWVAEAGRFELRLGASSADIRLRAWVRLAADWIGAQHARVLRGNSLRPCAGPSCRLRAPLHQLRPGGSRSLDWIGRGACRNSSGPEAPATGWAARPPACSSSHEAIRARCTCRHSPWSGQIRWFGESGWYPTQAASHCDGPRPTHDRTASGKQLAGCGPSLRAQRHADDVPSWQLTWRAGRSGAPAPR